jgi:hypothetical protein
MSRNGTGTYVLPVNSWNPATNGNSATAADWQSLIDDVESALTQSVSADGQTPITGNLNLNGNKLTGLAAGTATGDSLRFQQLFSQGVEADIASAATVDIGAQNTNFLQITGTTTITSFGANYNGPRFVRFNNSLILTHNASTLILPTGANITTAAGDRAIITPKATTGTADGWQVIAYQRANGQPLASTDLLNTTRIDVASASTVDLTANAPNTRNINITGTTTITAFTVAVGQTYFVRFAGTLTLTNNASIVTNSGASISTVAGDTCIIRATSANVVEVLSYVGRATTAQAQSGTDVSRLLTPATLKEAQIQLGTLVNSTSGTTIDFTGIPSWAKRVTVEFIGVSLSATAVPVIQLGDSGGVETTGYISSGGFILNAGASGVLQATTGFPVSQASIATATYHGAATFTLANASTNLWVASGVMTRGDAASICLLAGSKTLSAVLDRVRITSTTGTDTFDAGSINITWE